VPDKSPLDGKFVSACSECGPVIGACRETPLVHEQRLPRSVRRSCAAEGVSSHIECVRACSGRRELAELPEDFDGKARGLALRKAIVESLMAGSSTQIKCRGNKDSYPIIDRRKSCGRNKFRGDWFAIVRGQMGADASFGSRIVTVVFGHASRRRSTKLW
jgi:hypothetical protein